MSDYEQRQRDIAREAVDTLGHVVNGSTTWKHVGDAFGHEHGYLLQQIAYAMARGILLKCYSYKSCGDIMYLLAHGPNPERGTSDYDAQKEKRNDHPYHDGELTCDTVRAAVGILFYDGWRPSETFGTLVSD